MQTTESPGKSRALKVHPIHGDAGRYHVESHTHAGHIHVVDLNGRGGNGECTCIHFAMRCRKNHKLAGTIIPHGERGPTQCRHIAAAIEEVNRKL